MKDVPAQMGADSVKESFCEAASCLEALHAQLALWNRYGIGSGRQRVITFGFSAFLKVLSLNDKPQRSEITKRLGPSSSSGYDFHKSLRLHARRYLVDGEPMTDVMASAGRIVRLQERQSATLALQRLELWRAATPGDILYFSPVVFESPRHLFKVKFEPDFGLRVRGKTTAIHLWNTKHPKLSPGATYAALSLVAQAFETQEGAPEDVGVLSIREPPTAYLLSEVSDRSTIAASIMERMEEIIRGTISPPPPPEDRPTA